jgi:uncharacterized protein
MLLVDIRDLNKGAVDVSEQLPANDPLFEGLAMELRGPVAVSGRVSRAGDDAFLWQGRLAGQVQGSCRRCLTDVIEPFTVKLDVLFSADPDAADDPAVYPLEVPVVRVDLKPAVREELALAVTGYPLCREECAGLCPRCGADLNAGACAGGTSAEPG